MGGMQGLGPIEPEAEGVVFHQDWESRVHALVVASPTRGNIDAGRSERESIPGPVYLAMTYYERWPQGFAGPDAAEGRGRSHLPEMAAGPGRSARRRSPPITRLAAGHPTPALSRQGSYLRDAAPPVFRAGDRVRALNLNPAGHTRLPRYVRGRGRGDRALPRRPRLPRHPRPRGRCEEPACPLYTVVFAPGELGPERSERDSCQPGSVGALSGTGLTPWRPAGPCPGTCGRPGVRRTLAGAGLRPGRGAK